MLTIHEIGQYSVAGRGAPVLNLYMVEHQGGEGDTQEPAITYYMDLNGNTELLAWPDWCAFAHQVNAIAGGKILELKKDPAVELGIAVPAGMECPECGNRIMDFLCPLDGIANVPEEAEEADILCDFCGHFYEVGEW